MESAVSGESSIQRKENNPQKLPKQSYWGVHRNRKNNKLKKKKALTVAWFYLPNVVKEQMKLSVSQIVVPYHLPTSA